MQQLAARHAIGVEDEEFECVDVRILFEEILGFLHAGKCHVALFSARGHAISPSPLRARVEFLFLG
ncbi:hypothetical protein FQZ97_1156810 [compost metagenome]